MVSENYLLLDKFRSLTISWNLYRCNYAKNSILMLNTPSCGLNSTSSFRKRKNIGLTYDFRLKLLVNGNGGTWRIKRPYKGAPQELG